MRPDRAASFSPEPNFPASMESTRRRPLCIFALAALAVAWRPGVEAFAGTSRALWSLAQRTETRQSQQPTARRAVMEPPTRMRPPDVDIAVVPKAKDWAECLVQFGDDSHDAQEVWVFRRNDYEEFQRLIGLRLSYRKPSSPGTQDAGPARFGAARRAEAMQGTKVLCRERSIDASLVCSQCVKVFTGGAYEEAGIAVPAHPEVPDVLDCLALSVGDVEGTRGNESTVQGAMARHRSPLKQTAFCNYVNARFSTVPG
mmetsp:Transcript_19775/g.46128  ORF Transcript_19775/g.46128 Transcript_19775/m.46128 type:complete len:257 (+) Transcript_19775:23-793(+)